MINDYAGHYFNTAIRKQHPVRRNSSYKKLLGVNGTWMMWKSIGVMLVMTMTIGITSTVWFGWQIKNSLSSIGIERTTQHNIVTENNQLAAKRDRLLVREQIEAAAKKLGLVTPTARQLRKP